MKASLNYLWHMFRASYHWNRMIAKQDNTGISHSMLMVLSKSYRSHSISYSQSINALVEQCRYTTARSLIKPRQ